MDFFRSAKYYFVALIIVGLLFEQNQASFSAEPAVPGSQAHLLTPAAERSIEQGLRFLTQQQLEDGSFGTSGYARNVAVCGLAGMAFLSSGSTPGRGPYGKHIDRCIDYLMDQTSENGFIKAGDATSRGPMYGHGFALMFLCESYGMTDHSELRDRLGQAVDIVIDSQNSEGGWRYQPEPNDADVSVTVCQVMALRAARNAGIAVPRETIDRSIEYVKKCQNADGGFRYMLSTTSDPKSQFARSAAGVVALYNAGIYQGPQVENGLNYLTRFMPGTDNPGREAFYFYGQYYAVQAMWHAGGERWKSWYPAIRDELIARQGTSGAWRDTICSEYGTAMACIVLQVPNNYLPILQR